MSTCKGCGAAITFIKTPAGKWEVGDSYGFYSSVSGGVVILHSGEVMQAAKLKKSIKAFRPHWASCPAAEKFRKKKEAEL